MTPNTRAGQDSTFPRHSGSDHDTWRECFAAAIAGTIAAHRTTPLVDEVVPFAAKIADLALEECRKRRSVP
jgi:hypothetical protein